MTKPHKGNQTFDQHKWTSSGGGFLLPNDKGNDKSLIKGGGIRQGPNQKRRSKTWGVDGGQKLAGRKREVEKGRKKGGNGISD